MKKPVVNPSERDCPECMGAGFTVVKHQTLPGVRIYQACKECLGKGELPLAEAALIVRWRFGALRKLEPFARNAKPYFFIEEIYRLLG